MTTPVHFQRWRIIAAALTLLAFSACSGLSPTPRPTTTFYALDGPSGSVPATATPTGTFTLIVSPPHAAAGFDSARIIYVRSAHKLEYFAHSEWIDPPSRMLGPLLVAAIRNSGKFHAVVLTPGLATGEYRLDTEIIRLQHEFQSTSSQVRFTLRAYLVADKTRHVLAWREFEVVAIAPSEDAYGGVIAANSTVQTVLSQLSEFCTEVVPSVSLLSIPSPLTRERNP